MLPATKLFTETIEKTDRWLDDMMTSLGTPDPQRAYSVLRAVLHALRDRLTPDEAINLGAQLPMLVRGFYYDGWRAAGRPVKDRHKADFLERITDAYPGLSETECEAAVRAVFTILSRYVTPGEVEHVRHQLPLEVRKLWEIAA